MWLIKEKVNPLFILLAILSLSQCVSLQNLKRETPHKPSSEKTVVLAIDSLIKVKDYVRAEQFARLFEQRYPQSPYLDDVAYRQAYLHVIADHQNPFFDYHQGYQAFKNFLQKFPASNYALACNNWLKVLYLHFQLQKQLSALKAKNAALKRKYQQTKQELDQLQNTLKDLEKVIKR